MKAKTEDDFDTEVARWITEIDNAEKHQKKWVDRAKAVIERYRDERSASADGGVSDVKKFNILWSNTETLKPAVYFQTPKPNVTRRFKDQDQIARMASQVLERALSYSIDAYDFDGKIKAAVEDYLLPGRAVVRGIYNAEYEDYIDTVDAPGEGVIEDGGQFYKLASRKKHETAECKYWFWQDVIIPKGKQWEDTPWIAFRSYPTKAKLKDLAEKGVFEKELVDKIPLDYKPAGTDKNSPETFVKAVIYEIWDKQSGTVKYLSKGYKDGLLSDKEPGLKLTGFYPIPAPLIAVCTNDTNLPIPLYAMYQDQALELDELTARIKVLADALRVTGCYNGAHPKLLDIVEGGDNKLIPVENWGMFAEGGGIKGAVDFFPLREVVSTLMSLYEARDRVKQDLYEISGIADIIRGATNANETATAQRIKGRFASLRLEDLQKAVQAFIRDLLRIKAEIIADNFEQETLQKMTGIDGMIQTPQGPMNAWPQIMQLLKDDASRAFRIDIETDSTIRPDEEEEKMRRVEFLEASGGFLEKAMLAGQQAPQMVPLLGKMLLFAVRGFKVGRELEEDFENAINELANTPQPESKPDPAMIKAQADAQAKQQDMQIKQQSAQVDMQQKQAEAQIELMAAERKAEIELAAEARKIEMANEDHQRDVIKDQLKHEQSMEHDREKHQAQLNSRSDK